MGKCFPWCNGWDGACQDRVVFWLWPGTCFVGSHVLVVDSGALVLAFYIDSGPPYSKATANFFCWKMACGFTSGGGVFGTATLSRMLRHESDQCRNPEYPRIIAEKRWVFVADLFALEDLMDLLGWCFSGADGPHGIWCLFLFVADFLAVSLCQNL